MTIRMRVVNVMIGRQAGAIQCHADTTELWGRTLNLRRRVALQAHAGRWGSVLELELQSAVGPFA